MTESYRIVRGILKTLLGREVALFTLMLTQDLQISVNKQ